MKFKILIMSIAIATVLIFGGCSKEPVADTSSYSGDALVVSGISEEEIIVTVDELGKMKCEKNTFSTMSRKGEITVNAYGPKLDEILGKYNFDVSEVESISVLARDGYRATFDANFLMMHDEFIFSIANGDNPLEEDEQPIRLVIPDAPAEQWVKAVEKIEVDCY